MMMIRTRIARSIVRTTIGGTTRTVHSRVPLPYPIEEGIPQFLSPTALKTIAVDWQQGILERLTDQVRGTTYEDRSVVKTLVATASDPSLTLAFNYASEALNNSFFLSTLTPTPTPLNPSSLLAIKLNSEFSSYPSFISSFSAHVAGLHPSSGAYVWLVTDKAGGLGIVGTYAGGTVLVRERAQVGSERTDLVLGEVQLEPPSNPIKAETIVKKVESSSNEGPVRRRTALMADPPTSPSSAQKRSFSTTPSSAAGGPLSERGPMSEILYSTGVSSSSIGFGTPLEGVALRPLVCLSVHPHCYLQDYGVWGREQYVKNWWEAINWTKVEASYASITRKA